jgi:hypothetical protein
MATTAATPTCAPPPRRWQSASTCPSVTAQTVQQWAADASRSLFLCDVRTPEEFAAGSLPARSTRPAAS